MDADPGRIDHDVLAPLFEIAVLNAKARRPPISLSIPQCETLEPVDDQSPYPERGSGGQLLGGTAKSCGRAMAVGPGGN
jgi:hypothetical protein